MLPLSPPLPKTATYSDSADVLTLTFDQVLQTGPTAAANWTGCLNFPPRTAVDGSAPGTVAACCVQVPMVRGGICFGASRCNYAAAPPDLLGPTGVPVAAFADFPCTVIP